MATMTLSRPPAIDDCWRWSAEFDGDADECRYRLLRNGAPVLSGSIAALDGAHAWDQHDRRAGEGPHDLAEMTAAWLWVLTQCREVMQEQGGYVDWRPHPDPRRGMGEGPRQND